MVKRKKAATAARGAISESKPRVPPPNTTIPKFKPEQDKCEYTLHMPPRYGYTAHRPDPFWGYYLYKGWRNKTPEIEYSDNLTDSERFAKRLLTEKVLGMSLKYQANDNGSCKEKVAVISLACEQKIYVFHIARHTGSDIIAPSLRKVLETPRIIKSGVAVLSVYFARLKDHLDIVARSAFELSHLHNLLNERGKANTQIVPLETQVTFHTKLRFWTSHLTETSDWCGARLNDDQEKCVVNEAYASFILFHQMNAQRLRMKNPTPHLPLLAEKYLPYGMGPVVGLRIGSMTGSKPDYSVESYFRAYAQAGKQKATISAAALAPSTQTQQANPVATSIRPEQWAPVATAPQTTSPAVNTTPTPTPALPLASASDEKLFLRLRDLRVRQSIAGKVPPFVVAHDTTLRNMAQARPLSVAALQSIHGVGPEKLKLYGAEWLQEIRQFCDEEEMAKLMAPRLAAPSVSSSSQPVALLSIPAPGASQRVTVKALPTPMSIYSSSAAVSSHPGQSAGAKRPRTDSHESAVTRQPLGLISASQTNSAKRLQTENGYSKSTPAPLASSQPMPPPATPTPLPNGRPAAASFSYSSSQPQPQPRTPQPAILSSSQPSPSSQEGPLDLSPESRVFRSRLVALTRRVGALTEREVVSPALVDAISARRPRSTLELMQIPGALALVDACRQAQVHVHVLFPQ